jgi:hypothetical protein
MDNDPLTNSIESLCTAIEPLYATFANYPLQPKIDGCPLSTDPTECPWRIL